MCGNKWAPERALSDKHIKSIRALKATCCNKKKRRCSKKHVWQKINTQKKQCVAKPMSSGRALKAMCGKNENVDVLRNTCVAKNKHPHVLYVWQKIKPIRALRTTCCKQMKIHTCPKCLVRQKMNTQKCPKNNVLQKMSAVTCPKSNMLQQKWTPRRALYTKNWYPDVL